MCIRVAICISGEPRSWEMCAKSIALLREETQNTDIEVDVYFHFWDHITKRRSKYENDAIIEKINQKTVLNTLKPKKFVFNNKDSLDKPIQQLYDYINLKKFTFNVSKNIPITNKNDLSNAVKYTNSPCLSQQISMCESLLLCTRENIYYDIILRTRSDISFTISKEKINHLVKKQKLERVIQFPSISLRKKVEEGFIPFVEYCFFITSSKILTEEIFEDYEMRLIKNIFIKKDSKISLKQSHQAIPAFLREKCDAHFSSPLHGFRYKLYQPPLL